MEAAERVVPSADQLESEIFEGIASLVDQSLLRRTDAAEGEPRFSMLETIREFALEQLADSGEEDAVRRRHAAWCAALVEATEERFLSVEEQIFLDRLNTELDNLRTALAWTIGRGDAPMALRLAGAPWWFLVMRGFLSEGHACLEQALALLDSAASVPRAKAITAAGMVAWARGEVNRASDLLQQSVVMWRALGDPVRVAWSLHYLGLVAWQRGEFSVMGKRAEEALATAEEAGDPGAQAAALVTLGAALLRVGELRRARTALEGALQRFEAVGLRRGTAWAFSHLAEVAQLEGDQRQALKCRLASLNVYRHLADDWGIGEEVPAVAALAATSGRHEAAARLLGAAERMREATGIAPQNRISDSKQVARAVRERLGESTFAAAWAVGRSLTTEQIVAEAEKIAADLAAVPAVTLPAVHPYPAGLNEREVEVLRLVAQGLTNPQVAERLFLSPRTIDAHLQRIYAKLDVPNRGAAIRFAVEHSLL